MHTRTETHLYMYVRVCVCVSHAPSRTNSDTFLHSYTNANKPAQTHVHEHIYLYKYSYWIIFIRLTSIFMLVSIFILETCEYIDLLNMLLCRLSYFGGFNWFQSFSFVHFCRLSSFPWAFSFFCAAHSSLPKLPTRYVNLCTNLWRGGRTWSTRSLVVAINTSPHIQHVGECMQLTLFTYTGRQKYASIPWSATHLHYERICLRQSQQGLNSIANKWCVPSCPGKSWCFFDTCDWFYSDAVSPSIHWVPGHCGTVYHDAFFHPRWWLPVCM